jgi:hypothetical protein
MFTEVDGTDVEDGAENGIGEDGGLVVVFGTDGSVDLDWGSVLLVRVDTVFEGVFREGVGAYEVVLEEI